MIEKFLISAEEKTITAYVQEAPGGIPEVYAAILYNFDRELKIESVVLADNFIARYNRLLKAGKVKEPLDSNYTKKLAEGVTYLK